MPTKVTKKSKRPVSAASSRSSSRQAAARTTKDTKTSKLNTASDAAMASGEKQTFKGGCHCGAITYNIDLKPGTAAEPLGLSRCNCTFCQKPGLTMYTVNEPKDFTLLSPKDKSEMGNYQPRSKTVNKYFCTKCGCHVYGEGSYEYEGQKHNFFNLNAATLNQPQDGLDLKHVKVGYIDGLHDNWFAGVTEEAWANGLP